MVVAEWRVGARLRQFRVQTAAADRLPADDGVGVDIELGPAEVEMEVEAEGRRIFEAAAMSRSRAKEED